MKKYHTKNMQQTLIVEALPKTGFELSLKATQDECNSLAEKLQIESVSALSAELFIKQWRKGGVHINGTYTTTISQICVISLETFETILDEKVDQKFFSTTKLPELTDTKEAEMLDNDLDPPEALQDGALNVFDYIAEALLLQLDPYPKKAGVNLNDLENNGKFEINQPTTETEQSDKKPTRKPFANLDQLLKNK